MTLPDAQSTRLPFAKRMRPESEMPIGAWSSKQQRVDCAHGFDSSISDNNNNINSTSATSSSATSVFAGGDAEDAAGRPLVSNIRTDTADENAHSITSTLLQSIASSCFSWRLPPTQPLATSEQYLNEQLAHVASSAALELRAAARRNGLSVQELDAHRQENDAICSLNLVERVWSVVTRHTAATSTDSDSDSATLEREADASLRNAMDVMSLLLHLRAQALTRETELSERLDAAEKELARRTHQMQALAQTLETTRQQLAHHEQQARAKDLVVAAERRTLTTEKKALDVLVARLQGVETASRAQLRRKDVEYERLRKSLHDAVGRTSKEPRSIALAKPLNSAAERKRTAQLAQSHERHMAQQLVDALEQRQTALQRENDALVSSYAALQRQVEQLTAQYRKAAQLFLAKRRPGTESPELLALTHVALDDFAPTAFVMPAKMQLPVLLARAMDALATKLADFRAAMQIDCDADTQADRDDAIDALQHKLAAAYELVAEQDQLLQAALCCEPVGIAARRSFDVDAAVTLEDQAEALARDKHELMLQQQHIANERQLLRDQAMRLDQDRLALEMERQELVLGAHAASSGGSDDVAMAHVQTPPRHHKQQVERNRKTDSDVHMDTPLRVPVPASPATAALLATMGITPYDGGFSGS